MNFKYKKLRITNIYLNLQNLLSNLYLNFSLMREDDIRTPILFYTGENDLHKIPCELALNIFKEN